MALVSRMKTICDRIASILNDDADLAGRNWRVRKKAYKRGSHWEPGGYVVPVGVTSTYHENQQDEITFRVRCVVVDPEDGDLTSGMADHLGAAERVYEIFKFKAHGNAPAGLRTLNSAFTGEDVVAFQFCMAEFEGLYVDGAFEAGHDATSVMLAVHVTSLRRDSSGLGA